MTVIQRKFLRVETPIEATCEVVDPSGVGSRQAPVTILDLSAGGARVAGPSALARDQTVRLRVAVASPPLDVSLFAVVRTNEACETGHVSGVEFVAVDPLTRVALTRFVLASAKSAGVGSAVVIPSAA